MSTENTQTTVAVTKPKGLRELLTGDQFKAQVAAALPTHLKPDRFIRVALTALTRTPKLMDCTHESFFKCMLDLSALGIEPDGRRAHLIPYGNTCTLIIDYKGMIELAKRSGEVAMWRPMTVCEKDIFGWENGVVSHKVNFLEPRGKMLAVYSHVRTKDGDDDYEVMTLQECEAIRKRSKAATSGPWVTDYESMCLKTVMRRHSKRLTLSPEFREAVEKDGDQIDFEGMKRAEIISTNAQLESVTERLKNAAEKKTDENKEPAT